MNKLLGWCVLLWLGTALAFEIDSYAEEHDAIKGLEREIEDGWDFETIGNDVQTAIYRGWWELSMSLIEAAKTAGIDVTNKVYQAQSTLRKRMTGLTDALQKKRTSSRISPAFEWAQSPDSVFLNVKFSHKLDTPATLGCQSENVTMTSRTVLFRAECKEKNKKFELHLNLKEEIDPEESSWSMASVGRAMITLKKAEDGIWPRLLLKPQKPANMHVWWSMKDQHEEAIKNFERSLRRPEPKSGNDTKSSETKEEDKAAGDSEEASPTPTPTPSPEDELRKRIMKEKGKEKKQLEAEHRTVLAEITTRMRKEKGDIDVEARRQKKEVESRIAQEKEEAEAALKTSLEEVEKKYASRLEEELQALREAGGENQEL